MGIDTDLMLVELREGKLPLSLSMMLALLPAIDLSLYGAHKMIGVLLPLLLLLLGLLPGLAHLELLDPPPHPL